MIDDQQLTNVGVTYRFQKAVDLWQVLPKKLPQPFHTGHLAQQLGIDRWLAQRIAYCMRKTGAAVEVSKQGNARLYEIPTAA